MNHIFARVFSADPHCDLTNDGLGPPCMDDIRSPSVGERNAILEDIRLVSVGQADSTRRLLNTCGGFVAQRSQFSRDSGAVRFAVTKYTRRADKENIHWASAAASRAFGPAAPTPIL